MFEQFDDCLAGPLSEPCQEEFQMRLGETAVDALNWQAVGDPGELWGGSSIYGVSVKYFRHSLGSQMLLDLQFELEEGGSVTIPGLDTAFDTVDYYQVPTQS